MLDEMRMRTACFARAPQRCTSRLSKHLLLTFQEVTPLSKTRNQLIGNRDHLVRDRIEGAQHIKALPPTRCFDPTPGEAPQVAKKRAKDKMCRIHKKDGTLTSVGFG